MAPFGSVVRIHYVPEVLNFHSCLGNMMLSQWHQCLCYPGKAYMFLTCDAGRFPAQGGTQGYCNSARSDSDKYFVPVPNSSQTTIG